MQIAELNLLYNLSYLVATKIVLILASYLPIAN